MKKLLIDLLCTCGHFDSQHFCSEKHHKKAKHKCNITDRVWCNDSDVNDPPWNCKCTKFNMDNLAYLEEMDKQYYRGVLSW